MSVVDLTKTLIALQSFDDGKTFEKPMSDFLVAYAREHLPWMSVTVQEVAPSRCNVFLKDTAPTKLLVVDQIDTVVPEQGWLTDPLVPSQDDGKLFGLGASDSKGNVAAFLTALAAHGPTRGLAVLWYVDEEYFFQGMKHFTQSPLARTIQPTTILSIDGSGSALGTGCRGLVEFDILLRSQTGHSANPRTQGALRPFLRAYDAFSSRLSTVTDPQQGSPTAHIAILQAGCVVTEDENGMTFAKEGNRIPNYVKVKIEVRTTPGLGYADMEQFWRAALDVSLFTKVEFIPTIDVAGFATPPERIPAVTQAVQSCLGNVPRLDPSTFGYIDVAMLAQVYPSAAVCSFGIGEPGVNHKANEYVVIDRLEMGVLVYRKILDNVLE